MLCQCSRVLSGMNLSVLLYYYMSPWLFVALCHCPLQYDESRKYFLEARTDLGTRLERFLDALRKHGTSEDIVEKLRKVFVNRYGPN